jgi:hypothetical protein
MIDGDDTYPAEDAPMMVEYVLNGQADMVIGDRLSSTYFTENKRPFHNAGNVLVRRLINYLFRSNINDIMSGYRAFSKAFVKGFPILSQGLKLNTFSDGIKVEYKPFAFFGTAAFILFAFALDLFIPVFVENLHTGLEAKFPSIIVSGVWEHARYYLFGRRNS